MFRKKIPGSRNRPCRDGGQVVDTPSAVSLRDSESRLKIGRVFFCLFEMLPMFQYYLIVSSPWAGVRQVRWHNDKGKK